jgi:hypothetical protein
MVFLPPLARVLGQGGEWVEAPDAVASAGLCSATGFVHDWFCERTAPSPKDRVRWERIVAKGLFRPYRLHEKFLDLRTLEEFGRFAAEHPEHADVPRYREFAAVATHYCEVRDGKAGPEALKEAYLEMEPFFAAERARLRERFRNTLAAVLRLHAQARGASGES